MLNITDSDLFKLQDDKTKIFTNRITAVIRKGMTSPQGDSEMKILNALLADSLTAVRKLYADPVVLKTLDAVRDGRILLLELAPNIAIPKCMPFIRYKAGEATKVIVNVTPYLEKKKNTVGQEIYSISAQRLYPMLVTAYLSLNTFTNNYILPAKALSSAAYMWALMFNKVLVRTIALATNKEKYDAFMYFAMKFFGIYIAEVPEKIAEDTARAYLIERGRKDFPMVTEMTAAMERLNYTPYKSFRDFCVALFDERVSNIHGLAMKAGAKEMNELFYLNRFIDQYTQTALLALATFPYFLFVVMNAAYKTRIVNDAAFQDVISDKHANVISLINALI